MSQFYNVHYSHNLLCVVVDMYFETQRVQIFTYFKGGEVECPSFKPYSSYTMSLSTTDLI